MRDPPYILFEPVEGYVAAKCQLDLLRRLVHSNLLRAAAHALVGVGAECLEQGDLSNGRMGSPLIRKMTNI